MSNVVNRPPNKKSGFYKHGFLHTHGGIQSIVDGVKKVEIEQGEYHLCRSVMDGDKVYELKNKNAKEILDIIFQDNHCVFEQGKSKSGDFIICRLATLDPTIRRDIYGTAKDIINVLQGEKSCKVTDDVADTYSNRLGGQLQPKKPNKPSPITDVITNKEGVMRLNSSEFDKEVASRMIVFKPANEKFRIEYNVKKGIASIGGLKEHLLYRESQGLEENKLPATIQGKVLESIKYLQGTEQYEKIKRKFMTDAERHGVYSTFKEALKHPQPIDNNLKVEGMVVDATVFDSDKEKCIEEVTKKYPNADGYRYTGYTPSYKGAKSSYSVKILKHTKANGENVKEPHGVFYAEIKPIREGAPTTIVRVSTDEVGGFVAGYSIYGNIKSTKSDGYFKKEAFLKMLKDKTYVVISKEEAEKKSQEVPKNLNINIDADENNLSDSAKGYLYRSLDEYEKVDDKKKKEYVDKIKENLEKNERGLQKIGFGLDEEMVEAAKVFLKRIGETEEEDKKPVVHELKLMINNGVKDLLGDNKEAWMLTEQQFEAMFPKPDKKVIYKTLDGKTIKIIGKDEYAGLGRSWRFTIDGKKSSGATQYIKRLVFGDLDGNWITHTGFVDKAIKEDLYQKAIKEGRMTATDTLEIIGSTGNLEAPREFLKMSYDENMSGFDEQKLGDNKIKAEISDYELLIDFVSGELLEDPDNKDYKDYLDLIKETVADLKEELKNSPNLDIRYGKGGIVEGNRYGDWSITKYIPISHDGIGGISGGEIKLVNQETFETVFIRNDNSLRGDKYWISYNGVRIEDKNPKVVISKFILLPSRYGKGGGIDSDKFTSPKGTVIVSTSSHRSRDAVKNWGIKKLPLSGGGYKTSMFLIYEKDQNKLDRFGGLSYKKSINGRVHTAVFNGDEGDVSLQKLYDAEIAKKEKEIEEYENSPKGLREAEESKKRHSAIAEERIKDEADRKERKRIEEEDERQRKIASRLAEIEKSKNRIKPKTNLDNAKVENWSEIPAIWKRIKNVQPIKYKLNKNDAGLIKLSDIYCGKDNFRPVMSGTYFDEFGICITDFYKLLFIQGNHSERGVFAMSKFSQQFKRKDGEVGDSDGEKVRYPSYQAIVPREQGFVGEFEVKKLLSYIHSCQNYYNRTSRRICFKYDDSEIGFSGTYLENVCETLLALGCKKAYIGLSSPKQAGIFSPDKSIAGEPSSAFKKEGSVLLLLMPYMTEDAPLGAEDLDFEYESKVYFDFTDGEIHNHDGSIAKYDENEPLYPSYIDKDVVNLAKCFVYKQNSYLPILDTVKIENGYMSASNLETNLVVKVSDELENGCYTYADNYLRKASYVDIDDFPRLPELADVKKLAIVSSTSFSKQIQTANLFIGNDDLRPVMSGIKLHFSEGKMRFAATDAHALYKNYINAEVGKDGDGVHFILGGNILLEKLLANFQDQAITISVSEFQCKIEGKNFFVISRNIDGKYPNTDSIIPQSLSKKVNVSTTQLITYVDEKEKDNKFFTISGNELKVGEKTVVGAKVENVEEYQSLGDRCVLFASLNKKAKARLASVSSEVAYIGGVINTTSVYLIFPILADTLKMPHDENTLGFKKKKNSDDKLKKEISDYELLIDFVSGELLEDHDNKDYKDYLDLIKDTVADLKEELKNSPSRRYAKGGGVGGNSGYVGYSMSVRAQTAYENGKLTYSKLPVWAKRMVDAGLAETNEWHHTSSWGNETPFYNIVQFDIFSEAEKKELGIELFFDGDGGFGDMPKKAIKFIDAKTKEVLKKKNNIKEVRKVYIEQAQKELSDFDSKFKRFVRETSVPKWGQKEFSEMNGKYGWFDSSNKSYNMTEYYTGMNYETEENYKRAKQLQDALHNAKSEPIYMVELLKRGFDDNDVTRLKNIGLIGFEIMPESFYNTAEKNKSIIKNQLKELSELPRESEKFSPRFEAHHTDGYFYFLTDEEKQERQDNHRLISDMGDNFGSGYERKIRHEEIDAEYVEKGKPRFDKAYEEFLNSDSIKEQERKFNKDKEKAIAIIENLKSLFGNEDSADKLGEGGELLMENKIESGESINSNGKKYFVDFINKTAEDKMFGNINIVEGKEHRYAERNINIFHRNNITKQNLEEIKNYLSEIEQPSGSTVRHLIIWCSDSERKYCIKAGSKSESDNIYGSILKWGGVVILKKYSTNFNNVIITADELQSLFDKTNDGSEEIIIEVSQEMQDGLSMIELYKEMLESDPDSVELKDGLDAMEKYVQTLGGTKFELGGSTQIEFDGNNHPLLILPNGAKEPISLEKVKESLLTSRDYFFKKGWMESVIMIDTTMSDLDAMIKLKYMKDGGEVGSKKVCYYITDATGLIFASKGATFATHLIKCSDIDSFDEPLSVILFFNKDFSNSIIGNISIYDIDGAVVSKHVVSSVEHIFNRHKIPFVTYSPDLNSPKEGTINNRINAIKELAKIKPEILLSK